MVLFPFLCNRLTSAPRGPIRNLLRLPHSFAPSPPPFDRLSSQLRASPVRFSGPAATPLALDGSDARTGLLAKSPSLPAARNPMACVSFRSNGLSLLDDQPVLRFRRDLCQIFPRRSKLRSLMRPSPSSTCSVVPQGDGSCRALVISAPYAAIRGRGYTRTGVRPRNYVRAARCLWGR